MLAGKYRHIGLAAEVLNLLNGFLTSSLYSAAAEQRREVRAYILAPAASASP